jgi:site-specific DNA-methyltransferase (adenine-specific)
MIEINKIYNEDCLDTMAKMPDNFVDIVFTSPPYNRVRNDKYQHYDDNNADYYELLINSTSEALRVASGYVIVNLQQNHFNKTEFFNFIGYFANKINGVITWEKTNPQPSTNFREASNDYSITNAVEHFFFIKDGGEFRANSKISNIIKSSVNSNTFKEHGAVMKKEVAYKIISNFSKEGDIIYDPFGGCGTTAEVAILLKRRWILSEISKKYCDISAKRLDPFLKQLTLF